MQKIGITGGIGSGKTTVCKVFESLGVPVFYADDESKNIINSDAMVVEQVKMLFGAEVYKQGLLDRKKVAEVVFNDKDKLEQLNAIVHPAVGKAFERFCEAHQTHDYIIKEAAILFETGLNKELDKVIVVFTPDTERINRVMKRDGSTKEEVQNRMKNQMSQDEKVKLADFVIDNSGKTLVIPQVLKIHDTLVV